MPDWDDLISYVTANECSWPRQPTPNDPQWGIHLQDSPPHNRLLGPVFPRGGPSGLIRVHGETVCEWGDIHRPDMTFSVTKTCLAMVAGIAADQGLLNNIDSPVCHDVPESGFDNEHNRQITWRQLLHFTSEWSGKCFGIPDQIDHYRVVSMQPQAATPAKGTKRKLKQPGTHWEYNDVRINQFSLALLRLFQRPLPDVLNEFIMKPIGASDNWAWHGYENSYVEINGNSIQSVPGGGHWGGGLVIAPSDQALIAQLLLDHGRYNNKTLISKQWVESMLTPCPIAPFYGFFTWLNTANSISKAASPESYFAMGIGGQLIWHDPIRELVAVFRWLAEDAMEPVIKMVVKTLDG